MLKRKMQNKKGGTKNKQLTRQFLLILWPYIFLFAFL